MTSDEIRQMPTIGLSPDSWLKEIAFHVALLNERLVEPPAEPKAEEQPVKRGPGRQRKV